VIALTEPLSTLGSVDFLLTVTLYQGDHR